jgi:predicted nuclease with TOPRIM domain
MEYGDSEWTRKGATLGDGTAQKEFGLTWEEIVKAIRAGKLQYREISIYGNPCLRLLRREVENLARTNHGTTYLKDKQTNAELTRIDRELKRLRKQIAALEERKTKLTGERGK